MLVKLTPGSKVVELSTSNPKVKGLNPSTLSRIERWQKDIQETNEIQMYKERIDWKLLHQQFLNGIAEKPRDKIHFTNLILNFLNLMMKGPIFIIKMLASLYLVKLVLPLLHSGTEIDSQSKDLVLESCDRHWDREMAKRQGKNTKI
jgi:hypothetical protein